MFCGLLFKRGVGVRGIAFWSKRVLMCLFVGFCFVSLFGPIFDALLLNPSFYFLARVVVRRLH